jgi:hypothetical protein
MIGVAQDDLSLHLVAHIAEMASLDCARRPNRHEDRRFNRAVTGVQHTRTGIAFQIVGNYIEIHRFIFAQKYDFFPNKFLPLQIKITTSRANQFFL